MIDPTLFINVIALIGVAACAMSGVLAARQLRMDPFGAIILAYVAAVGGGTIRDLLLDVPIFWMEDNNYLYAVIPPTLVAMYWPLKRGWPYRILNVADALGLALFTILGTNKALAAGCTPFVAIIMGVTTGVAGGITRDVLSNQVPLIFRQEIYATASFTGALVFFLLQLTNLPANISMMIGMLVILLFRLAAIRWHLTMKPLGTN